MAKKIKQSSTPQRGAVYQSGGYTTIPSITRNMARILIIGETQLVTRAWDPRTVQELIDKVTGHPRPPRGPKVPETEYEGAIYRLTDGTCGLPAGGVKGSIVQAARYIDDLVMADLKGALRVIPDDPRRNLCRIIGEPSMRVDLPRVGMSGNPNPTFRPEFFPWMMDLAITFMDSVLSIERLMQLIQYCGDGVGFGEWRPGSKKSYTGTWGTFRLATPEEVESYIATSTRARKPRGRAA